MVVDGVVDFDGDGDVDSTDFAGSGDFSTGFAHFSGSFVSTGFTAFAASTVAGSDSSFGSTCGHRYAKYSPDETTSPSMSASANGPQITR